MCLTVWGPMQVSNLRGSTDPPPLPLPQGSGSIITAFATRPRPGLTQQLQLRAERCGPSQHLRGPGARLPRGPLSRVFLKHEGMSWVQSGALPDALAMATRAQSHQRLGD